MTENENDQKIAELEARIKRMEDRLNPPPPPPKPPEFERPFSASTYRLLDQMSVPQHILRQMQQAVPDEVVREIAKDGRK
jgi:hypothetical protein